MATRRPNVPSAQFSTGARPGQPTAEESVSGAGNGADTGTGTGAGIGNGAGTGASTAKAKAYVRGAKANRTPVSRGSRVHRQRSGVHGAAPPGGPRKLSEESTSWREGARERGAADFSGGAPVPARSFNGRLLVSGLVMAVITVILAPNVHTFVAQRADIAALKADIAQKTAQASGFSTELARWDDPQYVKQQARDRVSMLMPGETGYWVYGSNGTVALEGTDASNSSANPAGTSAIDATALSTDPWIQSLWQSIQKSAEVKVVSPAGKATSP